MENQQHDLLKKKDDKKSIQQKENDFSPVRSFMPPPTGIDPIPIQHKKNIIQEMQDRPEEERPEYFKPNIIQQIQRKKGELEPKQFFPPGEKKMPEDIQSKMENSFGSDFSDVKIFEGSNASSINALAYTQGNEIHFAPGKFNPTSQQGQELLGHELTHVLQQRSGKVRETTQAKGLPVNDDPALEQEADEMGKMAAQGKMIQGKFGEVEHYSKVMQRKEEEPNYNQLAKLIYEAIDGLGTDEEAVYNALSKLNHKEEFIKKLKETYKNLYKADLINDIDGDFDFGAYDKAIAFLTPVNTAPTNKSETKTSTSVTKPERPEPTSELKITSHVGLKNTDPKKTAGKTYNLPADVRKVQDQLYALGYLSLDKYEKEKIDTSKEKSEIPVERIQETITAIKEFQKVVRQAKNPDGIFSASGTDIQFLASGVPMPDKKEVEEIKNARKEFKVTYVSGEEELKGGISQEVGNSNTGNIQLDLKQIQSRLKELGYLNSSYLSDTIDSKTKKVIKPGESPDRIVTFYKEAYPKGTENIKAIHLPQTINAIKKFQTKMVSKWVNKNPTTKFPNLIGNDYTDGVIKNNDSTFKVLKDYKNYTLSYTGIDGKSNKSHTFTNFAYAATPNSLLTTDIEGVAYQGKQTSLISDKNELKHLGLDETYSKILFFISTHEGNFDAINTWDKAIFSYGFIQFAGGKDRGFRAFLAYFKHQNPKGFKERFQKYGIDAEYSLEKDGAIKNANITTVNEKGEVLRNDAAEKYINDTVNLYGVFLKASEDKEVQKMQIYAAIKNYVNQAKNAFINFNTTVLKTLDEDKKTVLKIYTGPNIEKYKMDNKEEYNKLTKDNRILLESISIKGKAIEFLSSEKGIACVLNITINEGNMKNINEGLLLVFNDQNFSSADELKNYSDLEKLRKIKLKVGIKDRVQSIIDYTGLSNN